MQLTRLAIGACFVTGFICEEFLLRNRKILWYWEIGIDAYKAGHNRLKGSCPFVALKVDPTQIIRTVQ